MKMGEECTASHPYPHFGSDPRRRGGSRHALLGLVIAILLTGCSLSQQQTTVPTEISEANGVPTDTSAPTYVPEPTSTLASTPTCTPTATGVPTHTLAVISSTLYLLTIEEYAIVSNKVGSPIHPSLGYPIPTEVFDKRRLWRKSPERKWVAEANQVLAPYSYRLVPKDEQQSSFPYDGYFLHDLYRGDEMIASDLTNIWPITVNDAGDDFALLVSHLLEESIFMRLGSMERWGPEEHWRHALTSPIFVGNDLVMVKSDYPNESRQFTVWRGDEVVYTHTLTSRRSDYPVKKLRSWQGHWVLEIDEQVIVDGQSLNEELSYDAIFHWQLLKERLFYFFRKDDHVGVSYDGQVLPYRYDEVVHYQCCGPAMFNVRGNETMVWFHALRDGMWYYVEMGVYGEEQVPTPSSGS